MDFDDPFDLKPVISRYKKYLIKKHMLLHTGNLVEVDRAVYNNYISNKDIDNID